MSRLRAKKKLYALDAEVEALEQKRRALELETLGAEVTDGERRARYFSIADAGLRRQLIGVERALHGASQRQRAAAIEYWTTVAAETRSKLEDLKSDSPTSAWRRRIWWDVLTILWILGGAGWLAFQTIGAAAGTVATAVWAWFIVRGREQTRLSSIREGEDLLRSSEGELQRAREDAIGATAPLTVFSPSEAETGTPDRPA
jgi:hypothetical protein